MEKLGIFYGHLEYMTAVWYILWQWRNKGQNQNKNQREGNTPPPPIAILLVLRKPKISLKLISQPTFIKFSFFFSFSVYK
jgi:hypothetical protein